MSHAAPSSTDEKNRLLVSEVFLTICGEGAEVGLPAVFVRTSGCNLRCPGWPCDTPYTSVSPEGEWRTVARLLDEIGTFGCRRVFLTGGEPLLWHEPLTRLAAQLKSSGYEILLQTNGTRSAPDLFALCDLISMDCKTPSSGEEPCWQVLQEVTARYPHVQVKFVVRDEQDLAFALEAGRSLRKLPNGCRASYCAQPLDAVGQDSRDTLLERLAWLQERVLQEGCDWLRVLPQVHVLLHGSQRRGV